MIRQLVMLVRHDVENDVHVNFVELFDDVPDLEVAIRSAAKEFLETHKGRIYVKGECFNFNFGDAMLIPHDITKKYGFRVRDFPYCVYDVHLYQNESLLPDGYDDGED